MVPSKNKRKQEVRWTPSYEKHMEQVVKRRGKDSSIDEWIDQWIDDLVREDDDRG